MAVEKEMPISGANNFTTLLRIVKRDFIQMPVHGPGVAAEQNEGRTGAALKADGTKYIG